MTAGALPRFEIIVAADAADGIARAGDLPWHLPGDLAHFKRTTSGTRDPALRNAVIMGRRTWASIPARFRPLPGRLNVVISRQADYALPEGVGLASSLDSALRRAAADPSVERLFVVGGGQIYAEALASPACAAVHLTRVAGEFGCDTFFPPLGPAWERFAAGAPISEGGTSYVIELWHRRGRGLVPGEGP